MWSACILYWQVCVGVRNKQQQRLLSLYVVVYLERPVLRRFPWLQRRPLLHLPSLPEFRLHLPGEQRAHVRGTDAWVHQELTTPRPYTSLFQAGMVRTWGTVKDSRLTCRRLTSPMHKPALCVTACSCSMQPSLQIKLIWKGCIICTNIPSFKLLGNFKGRGALQHFLSSPDLTPALTKLSTITVLKMREQVDSFYS